jgi:hypothetical protein
MCGSLSFRPHNSEANPLYDGDDKARAAIACINEHKAHRRCMIHKAMVMGAWVHICYWNVTCEKCDKTYNKVRFSQPYRCGACKIVIRMPMPYLRFPRRLNIKKLGCPKRIKIDIFNNSLARAFCAENQGFRF